MCAEMLSPIRGCPCMSSVECSFRVFADVLPAVRGGEFDRCHAFRMFAELLLMEMNIYNIQVYIIVVWLPRVCGVLPVVRICDGSRAGVIFIVSDCSRLSRM